MRLLLLLLPAVLACATPVLSQEPTDKEQTGLKGPVKTVRMKLYRSAQGEPDPAKDSPLSDFEVTRDRQGRVVEELSYNPDGTLGRRRVFTNDAAEGRETADYNPDGTAQGRVAIREELGKAPGTRRLIMEGYDGAFYAEYIKKYDASGRLIEVSAYDREGKLQSRNVSRFGPDVAFQEALFYNGAGALLRRHLRSAEGVEVFIYGGDGALISTEMHRNPVCKESDSYGNCKHQVTTTTVNKGGKVEEVTDVLLRTFTYY